MTATASVVAEERGSAYPGSPDLRGIVATGGEPWLQHRRGLQAKYRLVWRDIIVIHAMIWGGLAAACGVEARFGHLAALAAAVPLAAWIGYWLQALSCFGHEAAHFGLARSRSVNDRLANVFVLVFNGLEVAAYRRIHWTHHQHLGDLEDTEISYHNHPSLAFIFEVLTGIYLLRGIARYRAYDRARREADAAHARKREAASSLGFALARTAVFHLAIISALLWLRWPVAALVWIGSVPFSATFAALRQILEHRSYAASPAVDYSKVEHGPTTRMFAPGVVSRTFGAAGFDRHLLHHWDPAISYTCFDDMERFMTSSNVAAQLDQERPTYWSAWRRLTRERRA
jgi:fatty acid desaturase